MLVITKMTRLKIFHEIDNNPHCLDGKSLVDKHILRRRAGGAVLHKVVETRKEVNGCLVVSGFSNAVEVDRQHLAVALTVDSKDWTLSFAEIVGIVKSDESAHPRYQHLVSHSNSVALAQTGEFALFGGEIAA